MYRQEKLLVSNKEPKRTKKLKTYNDGVKAELREYETHKSIVMLGVTAYNFITEKDETGDVYIDASNLTDSEAEKLPDKFQDEKPKKDKRNG